jgi:hypothetical protein
MTGYTSNLSPALVTTLVELERRMGFSLRIDSGYRDHGGDAHRDRGDLPACRRLTRQAATVRLALLSTTQEGYSAAMIHDRTETRTNNGRFQ